MPQNTPQSGSATAIKVSPATAGSFILFVAFFLPWIPFLGGTVAGFELRQIWQLGVYLWAIPLAAGAATILGLSGRNNIALAQVAGGLPLIVLAVAVYQFGGELIGQLAIGGWLTLLSGLFLLCVVPRLQGKTTNVAAPGEPTRPSGHENQSNG